MPILIIILLCVGCYSILAQIFKVAPFKTAAALNIRKSKKKKNILINVIDTFALSVARYVPLNMVMTVKLNRILKAASIEKTPQEYVAKIAVIFVVLLPLVIVGFIMNTIFGAVLLVADFVLIFILYFDAQSIGKERYKEIEKDLPNFISNFINCIGTAANRNVIDIIDTYRRSYDNELTRELAVTVADMRTGIPELALQRLEARLDIPLFSELIRGIISTMHGEDMTIYFNNLIVKTNDAWRQSLTKQALKVKPKISAMSLMLAGYSMLALIYVFIQVAFAKGGGLL